MEIKYHSANKWIRLVISTAIFGTLFLIFGCQNSFLDSDEYTLMSAQVSGGYPLFLLAFRKIFGEENYFTFVSLLQNMLAAFAVWFLSEKIGDYLKCSETVRCLGTVCFAAPFIGTYFMSSNGVVLSCSILTEGLSYPLYYILIAFMLRVMFEHDYTAYIGAGVIGGILTLVRPQMAIPLTTVVIVSVVNAIRRRKYLYPVLEIMLAAIVIIGGSIYYRDISQKGKNSLNSATILTNLMCVSERTDDDSFEGEESEVFIRIWERASEAGYIIDSDVINPFSRAVAIENAHDRLKTDIMLSSMYEYTINEKGITDNAEQSVILKTWADDMSRILFRRHLGSYLYGWFSLGLIGLVRTNAIYRNGLIVVSAALYAIYIFLMHSCKKKGKEDLYRIGQVTIILITANAFGVATIIMCISRYMVYNMSLFYFILMCMSFSAIEKERKHG